MNVPFVDLAAQCQAPRPELEPALQAVLERGAFVMRAEHAAFEQAFASYLGVRHLRQQPAYAHLGHTLSAFPVTTRLGARILSLPMFPEITPQQIEQVVSVLRAALGAPTLA